MTSAKHKRLTEAMIRAASAERGGRTELSDPEMPGLCLRITSGVKVWVFRYRSPDQRACRMVLGDHPDLSLLDARDEARSLRAQVRRGIDPVAEKKKALEEENALQLRTMNQLKEAYFEACEGGDYRPRKKQKKDSTIRMEKGLWRLYLERQLADTPVDQVDRAQLREVLRRIKNGHGGRRPAPIQSNRCHGLLNRFFNFAVWDGRLLYSPMVGVDVPVEEQPRTRVLSDEEIQRLWSLLSAPSPCGFQRDGKPMVAHFAPSTAIAIKLALVTAQRRAEVAGMRKDELRLEEATWSIQGERSKNDEQHLVPLSPLALDLIRKALALQSEEERMDSPYVFPSPRDPEASIAPNALTHAAREIYPAARVVDATIHDLRRTAATIMASERLSVPPFVVSKVLGHKSDYGGAAGVTMRSYNLYQYTAEKRKALTDWGGLLARIVATA